MRKVLLMTLLVLLPATAIAADEAMAPESWLDHIWAAWWHLGEIFDHDAVDEERPSAVTDSAVPWVDPVGLTYHVGRQPQAEGDAQTALSAAAMRPDEDAARSPQESPATAEPIN